MVCLRSAALALLCAWCAQAGPLLDAVKAGNREAVRALLKNHAEVNAAEADGTTPLHWAVRADDLEMSQWLLQAGANAKAVNRNGVTPLSLAATNGNPAMVEALLKAGADPKAALPGGQTILMTAAHTGNPDVVKALLRRGADVNAKESTYGETALMWAASENHAGVVELLIEHGADFDARSNPIVFPKDRFGLEGVTTILPHGNWTVLMYAARQGATEAARVLVAAGAKLNLTDPDGTTAIALAIINGHYDTAALLSEKGADPNIADTAGMAALYAAVDMSTLGEVYGRPARKSTSKLTPLDLMAVLLAHGANPNAPLKPGDAAACGPILRRTLRKEPVDQEIGDAGPGAHARRSHFGRRNNAADARRPQRRCSRNAAAAGARRGSRDGPEESHHGAHAGRRTGTRPGSVRQGIFYRGRDAGSRESPA